ncbi:CCC2 [Symbiodinium sp. CCMP2592]|nr:CCC2 [Symbiodinium sp. CCMP2592]
MGLLMAACWALSVPPWARVELIVDSEFSQGCALGTIALSSSHDDDPAKLVRKIVQIHEHKHTLLEICWTRGHAGDFGNELADRVADFFQHARGPCCQAPRSVIRLLAHPLLDWAWAAGRKVQGLPDLAQLAEGNYEVRDFLPLECAEAVCADVNKRVQSRRETVRLRICTANVCTLKHKGAMLRKQLQREKVHIFALQETRLANDAEYLLDGWLVVQSAALKGKDGCAFWVNAPAIADELELFGGFGNEAVTVLQARPDWLVIRLKVAGIDLVLITYHAPHSLLPESVIRAWWRQAHQDIVRVEGVAPLLFLGDANATVSRHDREVVGSLAEERADIAGECLVGICSRFRLALFNTYPSQDFPESLQKTWKHKCIDYVAAPCAWHGLVEACKVDVDLCNAHEDHEALCVLACIPCAGCVSVTAETRSIRKHGKATDWESNVHLHAETLFARARQQQKRQLAADKREYISNLGNQVKGEANAGATKALTLLRDKSGVMANSFDAQQELKAKHFGDMEAAISMDPQKVVEAFNCQTHSHEFEGARQLGHPELKMSIGSNKVLNRPALQSFQGTWGSIGDRQPQEPGDALADCLFAIVFADAMLSIRQALDADGLTLSPVACRDPENPVWADDSVVPIASPRACELVDRTVATCKIVHCECARRALQLNYKKGKTEVLLSFAGKASTKHRREAFMKPEQLSFQAHGQPFQLRQACRYVHLGTSVEDNGTAGQDLRRKLAIAVGGVRPLAKPVLRRVDVAIKARSNILRVLGVNAAHFNCAVWGPLTERELHIWIQGHDTMYRMLMPDDRSSGRLVEQGIDSVWSLLEEEDGIEPANAQADELAVWFSEHKLGTAIKQARQKGLLRGVQKVVSNSIGRIRGFVRISAVAGPAWRCQDQKQVRALLKPLLKLTKVWGGSTFVTKLGIFFVLIVFYTMASYYAGLIMAPFTEVAMANPWVTGLSLETFNKNWLPHYHSETNFGVVLSVFFPCFTGILSGANRADILRDPPKNIKDGTFGAIIFSFFMYSSFFILWGCVADYRYLQGKEYYAGEPSSDYGGHHRRLAGGSAGAHLVEEIVWNPFPHSAQIGIIISSLSQALQCLIVAPRLLQNIARDKILGVFDRIAPLSKHGEPVRALFCTYIFGALLVLIGEVNAVAPLLTMCFLVAYTFMNFSCFVLTWVRSPGFRPAGMSRKRWRCWYMFTGLLGSIVCLSIMVIVSQYWAVGVLFVSFCLYLYINWRLEQREPLQNRQCTKV